MLEKNFSINLQKLLTIIVIAFSLLLKPQLSGGAQYSELWGREGELWIPNGRLPNFSQAGYHRGDISLPNPPAEVSVKDFGAKGDGRTDDSAAFKQALNNGGVIYIPQGKYRIADQIIFTKGNTILRGAGKEKTILFFPNHLESIFGPNYNGEGHSAYSYRGGLIEAHGLGEVGLEDLTIQFPATLYNGHLVEKGHNAVDFSDTQNSWIRNVTIVNADFGINFSNCRFCTATGIYLNGGWLRRFGKGGHYGISLGGAKDCLVTDFQIDVSFLHDLSISTFSTRNVFSNGAGVNIVFDHHGREHPPNLFSNINVGKGSRVFKSSGKSGLKIHDYGTYWNIRKSDGSPAIGSGPGYGRINVIGSAAKNSTKNGKWIESLNPADILPQDLHASMHARSQAGLLPNQQPVADAGSDRTVQLGKAAVFDGFGSVDPDGDSLSYSWDFGDGGKASGKSPSHTYRNEGTYTVTLTVADPKGDADSDTLKVKVRSAALFPPTTGLIAHWSFDDGSGDVAEDSSGNGYHATLSNMDPTEAWVNGKIGAALAFDGIDDYVNAGSPQGLDNLAAFTYAAWINPTSWGKDGAGCILSKKDWIKHWRLMNDFGEQAMRGFVGTQGTGSGSSSQSSAIKLNDWQHVAITYDDGDDRKVRLYKNGNETQYASRNRASGPILPEASGDLRIGGYDLQKRWFEGRIDDVRIYNRALQPSEIQALANP